MITTEKVGWAPDSASIDINREEQIVFWTSRLGVSNMILRQAIRFAGSKSEDVLLFLRTGRLSEQTRFRRRGSLHVGLFNPATLATKQREVCA